MYFPPITEMMLHNHKSNSHEPPAFNKASESLAPTPPNHRTSSRLPSPHAQPPPRAPWRAPSRRAPSPRPRRPARPRVRQRPVRRRPRPRTRAPRRAPRPRAAARSRTGRPSWATPAWARPRRPPPAPSSTRSAS
uniref:Uncharacterized protein n=1 Tax=Arundo donax TaxID=35708 RepID=A0A0A9I3H9_ARUDO